MALEPPKFKGTRKGLHQDGSWDCPRCNGHHEHPHWRDHHQIDDQNVDKDYCDDWCKESEGEQEFTEDNVPKPYFCPRCGWEEGRIQFVKKNKGEVLEVV